MVLERNGQRIVLRREARTGSSARVPDYTELIQLEDPDSADTWTWEWTPSGVVLREHPERG